MKFKPKIILDMTMGWGGRLIGACALDIYKYIGIDNNLKLIEPYKKLEKILKPYTKTKIELYFGDALLFDYNKHEYDLVLTSPPYYNIEIYTNQEKRTKEEWNNNFYTPLFIKSFNGLKKGGYYCLNIPFEVYENVALKILGEPFEKILMPKNKRSLEEKYKEYIYIWKK